MADHGAIADAGETLVELLRDRMAGLVTEQQVVLASPVDDDLGNAVRLTLYLFDVSEDGHRRNSEPDPTAASGGEPLRLELSYLLTAHPGKATGNTTTTAKTIDEHTVLGRAMQVLNDNAVVDGPDLRGSLAADDEALRVSILPESTDRTVNVWNTFQGEPYRPSVAYLVTPVEIESRRDEPIERVEEFRIEEYVQTGGSDE